MDSALVIKVKDGDTLWRFNARVDENNRLDLDMVRLRAKILSLLNFSADANFIMRYLDEDGDLVTLVDDDDLQGVMRQRLKFLRIDVHRSCESGGNSNARSSGSSTPLRSPPLPNQFLSENITITEALKSVPEPLREALSNICLDVVSKAATSSTVVAILADCIYKMGQSILNSDCQPQVAAGLRSRNDVPEEPVTLNGRDPKSTCVDSNPNASQQVEAGNVNRGVVTGVSPLDLSIHPCDPPSQSTNVNTAPLSSAVPDDDGKKGKDSTDDSFTGDSDSSGTSTSYAAPENISTQTTAIGYNNFVECPSFGNHRIHPFKRSHGHTDATCGIFHKGIRCDGVYPITGPRFKSKGKKNYDLCSICLNEMGNETDYMRIDRPVSVRAPRSFKFNGVYEHQQPWMGSPTLPQPFRKGLKNARPKLDSRFVSDVSLIDGTMMAPCTSFTKIWRMRNIGTSVWPKGTQLVWIGGDKFSNSHSVDLEVPEDGLPVDKELDIAVDFRAPQLAGRYISYWRMACPSGKKFGHCIWVLIQVDASLKDSFYDSSQGLDLNIPLDVSGSKGPQIIEINVQPILDDAYLQPHKSSAPTEPVNQMVDELPRQELENNSPVNESTFVGQSAPPPATSVASLSVSYPVDISETAPVVPSNQQSFAVDAPSSTLGFGGNNSVEQSLLKELEEMGFKQVELNKYMLRMNEYNLEQSVVDLCGVSEWEPILD